MIEAKGVSLIYPDGTTALNQIHLKIHPGEMVYITGPSGSGKTSLLKLFMGSEFATTGKLEVLGCPLVKGHTWGIRKMRRLIGPVFQEFRLIKGRTALDNVMLGMRFIGLSPRNIKAEAINALIRVGLEPKIHSKVEHLSWGECQRVAIARAVARKPVLILADEPTGNLDKQNAIHILELLASFKDEHTAVVITTHATHLIEGQEQVTYIHMSKGKMTVERVGDHQ